MGKKGNILIVDDNRHILESLSLLLKHDFNRVFVLDDPGGLVELLSVREIDLVLLDMNYSAGARDGREGLYWLQQIRKYEEEVPVVLMTAYGGVELAVQGMKEGAADFVLKPWNPDKLIANIKTHLSLRESRKKLNRYQSILRSEREGLVPGKSFHSCSSAPMRRLYEAISKIAPTDANILITGENGTGKEIIARQIHNLSARSGELMVAVDLGALPHALFESELFGHKKGSFTDALEDRTGRFELASGGTLFLDEIGNIPPLLQVKLLSVLERREVHPIGAAKPVPVDIRLIAATNARLQDMVARQEFREDLYYRVNTINLHLPALRERPEDIPGFCTFFLGEFSRKYRRPGLKLSPPALQKLKAYPWPGNVRELKHALERAVILSEGNTLRPGDFVFHAAIPADGHDHVLNLKEVERRALLRALDVHNGNVSRSAEALGITRATLYAKMEKYRI